MTREPPAGFDPALWGQYLDARSALLARQAQERAELFYRQREESENLAQRWLERLREVKR